MKIIFVYNWLRANLMEKIVLKSMYKEEVFYESLMYLYDLQ